MQVLSSGSVRLDAEKFNRELARHGLNGKRLAELSGLDKSVVSDARRGRPIRHSTMRRLVEVVVSQPLIAGAELLA